MADIVVRDSSVSNHHCLLFMAKNKSQDTVAVIQDLSSNGTFLNEAIIGRNQRKELKEGDEIAVFDKAHFIFRYPRSRQTTPFLQQYTLLEPLGKGYFAEVFSCVEKANGKRYAVKIFSNTSKLEEYSKTKDLQQEIAVPMGVSHPNLLCVKDTFAVGGTLLIVMELAKSDLFNRIVQNRKMTENETRNLFIQLFQGIKYLVYFPQSFPEKAQSTNGVNSMTAKLFTAILNWRKFEWWTTVSTQSLQILDLPRSSIRNMMSRVTWHPRC